MTLPAADHSPAAKVLQDLGYGTTVQEEPLYVPETNDVQIGTYTTDTTSQLHLSPPQETTTIQRDKSLQVKCLSINATLPARATDSLVGYDKFSAVDLTLQPKTHSAVPLDIAIVPPEGTYAQLKSRSGMSLKHSIDVQAGTIDRDYTGNIQVVLYNSGESPYAIKIGDRIAQLVLLQIQTPEIAQTTDLVTTNRGERGFGSTGVSSINTSNYQSSHDIQQDDTNPTIANLQDPVHTMDLKVPLQSIQLQKPHPNMEKPFDIYFCTDPFDSTMEIDVPIKGDHPTLGFIMECCDNHQRLQVTNKALSTPGSRLKSWRTVIQRSYILTFNDFTIQTKDDLEHAIGQARLHKMLKDTLVIATDKSYGVHPMEGILQIHFDQLNMIAKHLEDIRRDHDKARGSPGKYGYY
jgi:dUTP pyrophosphatase